MPFEIVQNDIVNMQADAIVNTVSPKPGIGYGVDAGIHKKAGPERLAAREQAGYLPVGSAVITPGFSLDARYVIHTVGPVWRGGTNGEAALLAACYRSSLTAAGERGIASVDFPSISTGIFGYPVAQAAPVALKAILDYLAEHPEMQRVRMVCHTEDAARVYRQTYNALYAGTKEERL